MFGINDKMTYDISSSFKDNTPDTGFSSGFKNLSGLFRASVVNANDPLGLGRVQVRVPSLHGVNPNASNFVPDVSLPWATPGSWNNAGNNMGEFNPPTKGNRVFVAFEGGSPNYPVYLGGIPTLIGNTKVYTPEPSVLGGMSFDIDTSDFNLDFVNGTERCMFKSLKGATIIVDDFDAHEYIKIIDQSGQTIVMGNDGDALPRRVGTDNVPSTAFIELSNNRGEVIKITDGRIWIDGAQTYINSPDVQIPNFHGGGGPSGDYYTKEEINAMMRYKSRVFFQEPTTPYQVNDVWYNEDKIYRCILSRETGDFHQSDWILDTSQISKEEVEKIVDDTKSQIESNIETIYATKEQVDSSISYTTQVLSTNGEIFKNGLIDTTLTAFIRKGNADISNSFLPSQFSWYRVSNDKAGDVVWNLAHHSYGRSVYVSSDDVSRRATFFCELNEEIDVIPYITSGLIEIFDGHTEPDADGNWVSMLHSNKAIPPSSGVVYSKENHSYFFEGTDSSMVLENPIPFSFGYTFEFSTGLSTSSFIQSLLSSTDDTSKISCAVAGNVLITKDTIDMNVTGVRLNKRNRLTFIFRNADKVDVYANGTFFNTFTQSQWESTTSLLSRLGKRCSGYIYSIRVYNRVLTPQEILTNYNTDVSRFN